MIPLAATLLLGASPSLALLPAHSPGDDPLDARGAAARLAEALGAEGVVALSGPELRRRLVGAARPVVDGAPSRATELVARAARAYDDGLFPDAAKAAALAAEILDASARSRSVEALAREAQLLWGAALLGERGADASEEAGLHFRFALAREPRLRLDEARFSPPVRREVERQRAALAALPSGQLDVPGAAGAEVYVDGLAQGQAPLALSGLPGREAWVWLELAGRRSLAHRVTLGGGAPATLTVDLDLEGRLDLDADSLALVQLPDDPEANARLGRLARAAGLPVAVAVRRSSEPLGFELAAVGPSRLFLGRWAGAAGPARVARELLAERLGQDEAAAAPAAAVSPAPLGAARAGSVDRRSSIWPWIGVAAAVVAVGIGGFALLHATSAAPPDVALSSSVGSP